MTPAELGALLRIKQVRERRARGALEAARRDEQQAVARRVAAQQAHGQFTAEAAAEQRRTFEEMEAADSLRPAGMQAKIAGLADLRVRAVSLARAARQAAAAEQGKQDRTALAVSAHAAAMRGTEAFQALHAEITRAEAASAERREELEAEEPRPAPKPGA